MTGQAQTYRPTIADTAGGSAGEIVDEAVQSGHRSAGSWGMLIVIINEAVIFASLVASYFYLRFNTPVWPPDGIKRPELVLPAIMTVILVSSSVAMHWSQAGIRRGNQGQLRLGLLLGFVLGLVFLGIQLYEYSRAEFGPAQNVYTSLFFTITGIHGLHVLLGLLMNFVIQVWAGLGHFNARRFVAVENVVLYWHFVDVVWLVIFASLYVSTYL